MSVTTIDIQLIMPTTKTSQQETAPQPEIDGDAAFVAEAAARQAPPPPGIGVLVDKTV